jgi:DNA-binding transcriptional ArsR family regulator
MTNVTALLTTLADPTRQRIVEALRAGPLTVGELTDRTPVTRSAVSQHLQILKGVDVVDERREGTRRYYSLKAEALGELRAYVDRLWNDALSNFTDQDAPR